MGGHGGGLRLSRFGGPLRGPGLEGQSPFCGQTGGNPSVTYFGGGVPELVPSPGLPANTEPVLSLIPSPSLKPHLTGSLHSWQHLISAPPIPETPPY